MKDGTAKCILLCLGILLLPLLAFGVYLNIHRHSYFDWQERVYSSGPWAEPSVWAGEDGGFYLVSREDGSGGCKVTAYLVTESGCEEFRATMSEGVRTLFLRDGEGHSVYTGEFDVRGDVMTLESLEDADGREVMGETELAKLPDAPSTQSGE